MAASGLPVSLFAVVRRRDIGAVFGSFVGALAPRDQESAPEGVVAAVLRDELQSLLGAVQCRTGCQTVVCHEQRQRQFHCRIEQNLRATHGPGCRGQQLALVGDDALQHRSRPIQVIAPPLTVAELGQLLEGAAVAQFLELDGFGEQVFEHVRHGGGERCQDTAAGGDRRRRRDRGEHSFAGAHASACRRDWMAGNPPAHYQLRLEVVRLAPGSRRGSATAGPCVQNAGRDDARVKNAIQKEVVARLQLTSWDEVAFQLRRLLSRPLGHGRDGVDIALAFYRDILANEFQGRFASALLELLGIDYHRTVARTALAPGTTLQCYCVCEAALGTSRPHEGRVLKDKSGNLLAPRIGCFLTEVGVAADRLGIFPGSRQCVRLRVMQAMPALKTTATGLVDFWTDKPVWATGDAVPHLAGGRAIQYRVPKAFAGNRDALVVV